MQHISPVGVLDRSGHTAQHFSSDEEKEYYEILHQYDFNLKLDKIHLITVVISEAINERKLTAENVLEFLNKYSWYGKNISKGLPNGKTENYNWLNLLAPAIHDYINRLTIFFLNPQNYPNMVLCIDSLALKFEGLFRDVCELSYDSGEVRDLKGLLLTAPTLPSVSLRGGFWRGGAGGCRAASRSVVVDYFYSTNIGFRLARSLPR